MGGNLVAKSGGPIPIKCQENSFGIGKSWIRPILLSFDYCAECVALQGM
jgi:hypothetical protein